MTKRYLHGGSSLTITELAELTGMPSNIIRDRLRRGWTLDDAISAPICTTNRQDKLVTLDGVTKTLVEWCHEKGLSFQLVNSRRKYGWSDERIFGTPVHKIPKYTHNGKTLTLHEWSKIVGISRETLTGRINWMGWSVAAALTTPVGKYTSTPKRRR